MAAAPNILIAGASLAGLRTAEAIRAALPEARVTVVGDEVHPPYNRPPLSKEIAVDLAQGMSAGDALAKIQLRSRLQDGDVEFRLGLSAVSVDAQARRLDLSDGSALSYDWLVAATGLRPRRLPLKAARSRRHVLRSFDDARRLAAAMTPGARMVVAGGGFIGCEIAATAHKLGLHVVIVEPMAQPMIGALGARVASAMAALHRANGVQILAGHKVAHLEDDDRHIRVLLDDGHEIVADLLVEALGSHPNTEWLAEAGLDLSDGILCHNTLEAVGNDRILAVGDVARFANPLFGGAPRRVEHWCVPGQTAKRAAQTIAARALGIEPEPGFAPMPSFWTDQHGVRLQSFGAPALADATEVLEGDLGTIGTQPCVIGYLRRGEPVGVLSIGAPPAMLVPHRARLDRALTQPLETTR